MTFIGLIGFGKWGKKIAQSLPSLRAICDVDDSALESLPECIEYFTTDINKLLKDPYITCIVIATPIKTHFKLAKKVLRSGRDCFVEKPLAMCLEDTEELIALADKMDRILMVGHILRYHPAVQKMYQMINAGAIGEIMYIRSVRSNPNSDQPLWNLGPHDVSLVLGLVGNISVTRASKSQSDISIFFRHSDGEKGSITVRVGKKDQIFYVEGTEGTLTFDGHNLLRKVDKIEEVIEYNDNKTPLEIEFDALINSVVKREVPLTDGYDGQAVVTVLEEAQKRLDIETSYHPTAIIDKGAKIGTGTKIWHFCHLMPSAVVGRNCNIGQNCFLAGKIGNGCKVQNNVSIYDGVVAGDNVFFGPSCVLTNDKLPRAQIKSSGYMSTIIEDDVTIGANATIVCGVTLGRGCMIGAGSVVTKDVPPKAIVVGNPARLMVRRKSL